MVNQLLLALVNSVLGVGKPTSRNNYAYHCPFCHHVKPKLEVNLMENKEGKSISSTGPEKSSRKGEKK